MRVEIKLTNSCLLWLSVMEFCNLTFFDELWDLSQRIQKLSRAYSYQECKQHQEVYFLKIEMNLTLRLRHIAKRGIKYYLTILGWSKTLRQEISLSAVEGIPSSAISSLSFLTFFSAIICSVYKSLA